MSDTIYDGPANLVTSVGDSFATCHLVAEATADGWKGELTQIAFRTQMVPFPLNDSEWLRLDGVDGQPVLKVNVADEKDETAQVSADGNPFG
jgi:hypothetical protein